MPTGRTSSSAMVARSSLVSCTITRPSRAAVLPQSQSQPAWCSPVSSSSAASRSRSASRLARRSPSRSTDWRSMAHRLSAPQVPDCAGKQVRIVAEVADADVAVMAQQAANMARGVAVVNVPELALATRCLRAADGTPVTLLGYESVPVGLGQAVSAKCAATLPCECRPGIAGVLLAGGAHGLADLGNLGRPAPAVPCSGGGSRDLLCLPSAVPALLGAVVAPRPGRLLVRELTPAVATGQLQAAGVHRRPDCRLVSGPRPGAVALLALGPPSVTAGVEAVEVVERLRLAAFRAGFQGDSPGNAEGPRLETWAFLPAVATPQGAYVRFFLRELHDRQRTLSGPLSAPPAATGVMWSAVRSLLACADTRQPGHQSPNSARHSRTAEARRALSACVRSGRRTSTGSALALATWRCMALWVGQRVSGVRALQVWSRHPRHMRMGMTHPQTPSDPADQGIEAGPTLVLRCHCTNC